MSTKERSLIVAYITAGTGLVVIVTSLTVYAINYGVAKGETSRQLSSQEKRIEEIRRENKSRDSERRRNSKNIELIQKDIQYIRKYIENSERSKK